jgi:hypothetical protein
MSDKLKTLLKNVDHLELHEKFVFTTDELEHFVNVIVKDCILQIQYGILRNGNTEPNQRSYQHVRRIAKEYDIRLPILNYSSKE